MPSSASAIDRDLYQRYRKLILENTGIVFADSREEADGCLMLQNRLGRSLNRLRIPTYEEYFERLRSHQLGSAEWTEFIHSVSTHKTGFFREPSHFDTLSKHVEGLWRNRDKAVQIWSAACSTGEEAYSIAITLLETARTLGRSNPDFQTVATDIDSIVLDEARQGIFQQPESSAISAEILRRYFLQGQQTRTGLVRVKDQVRERVRFETFNLVTSDYGAALYDAIFCRNVLIYFAGATRDAIVTGLASRLAPDGLLLLGHAESFSFREDLESVAPTVYRRRRQ